MRASANFHSQNSEGLFHSDNLSLSSLAVLIIDLLLNGDNDQETGYGGGSGYAAPATGYGTAPADSYGAAPAPQASYGAAPAPSYSAPAPSYGAPAPSSSYGYLKRTLNTASRVEKALDEAEALYK